MTGKEKTEIVSEVRKGLTVKTLIIGVIVVAFEAACFSNFGTLYFYRAAGYYWNNNSLTEMTVGFGVFTIVMIVVALINHLAKRPVFTRQETAVLLMMTVMAPYLIKFDWGGMKMTDVGLAGWAKTFSDEDMARLMNYMPDAIAYKNHEYWNTALATPQYPVNWGAIFHAILWWGLMYSSLAFTSVFLSLLLRRFLVDVESIGFPISDISSELVSLTQAESSETGGSSGTGGVRLFKSKLFWIGFAIQAIWVAAVTYPDIVPWFFDRSFQFSHTTMGMINRQIVAYPVKDLTEYQIIPWAPLIFMLEPWQLGWCSFLSIEVLAGVILGWIICWVINPAARFALGIYSGDPPGMWQLVAHGFWYSLHAQGSLLHFLLVGLFIGVGLIPLWMNRHAIVPVLRGLFKEPTAEFDPDKPISYRWTWIGLVGCAVLVLLVFAVGQIDLLMTVATLVIMCILYLGILRVVLETGGFFGAAGLNQCMTGATPFFIPISILLNLFLKSGLIAVTPNSTSAMTILFCSRPDSFPSTWTSKFLAGGIWNLNSVKLGKLQRTEQKDVLKAILIAITITVFGVIIYQVSFSHFIGTIWGGFTGNIGSFATAVRSLENEQMPGAVTRIDEWVFARSTEVWALVIIGFLVALVFTYARRELKWFNISVTGFVLGAWMGWYMWASIIAALIIKYALIRTGGIDAYRNKWNPLALGFIAAGTLQIFIVGSILWQFGRITVLFWPTP